MSLNRDCTVVAKMKMSNFEKFDRFFKDIFSMYVVHMNVEKCQNPARIFFVIQVLLFHRVYFFRNHKGWDLSGNTQHLNTVIIQSR